MPSPIETQRQQLRTEIARSRMRWDRHARQLATSTTRLVPIARFVSGGKHRTLLITVALGTALVGWIFNIESLKRWREQLLGHVVSKWIDRLLRRIRVAAWKFRRSSSSHTTEATE